MTKGLAAPLAPWMNLSQLWGIVDAIPKGGESVMVEWGAGGSSLFWLERTDLRELYVIEHNPEWARKVSAALSESKFDERATMICHTEKHTVPYVRPRALPGQQGERNWCDVESESPIGMWEYCSGGIAPLERADVILVDGLVRQVCLAEAAMRAKTDCRLFLHDTQDPIYRWGIEFMDRNPDWRLVNVYHPTPEDQYHDMDMHEWVCVR